MGSTAAHTNLKRNLAQSFRAQGWLTWSNPANARTGRGRSDLEVCAAGLFIAVEVKTGGGKLTPPQHLRLTRVNHHGGLGFTARSTYAALRAIQQWITTRDTRGVLMPDDFELDVDALFAEAEEHVPTTNVEDEKAAALAEAARTLAPAQVAQAAEVTTSSDTPTRAEFNEVLRITKQNEQRLDRILANSEQLLRQLQVSKPQTAEEPPEVAEVPVDASGEVDIAGMFGETETPKPATRRRSPKK